MSVWLPIYIVFDGVGPCPDPREVGTYVSHDTSAEGMNDVCRSNSGTNAQWKEVEEHE